MQREGVGQRHHLSVVVTSRNDDHGGQMLRRLGLFAHRLAWQACGHRVAVELIIVEWNPPEGPRLHEAADLPANSEFFELRIIQVPPEQHRRFRNCDAIPLFQMIAKNVGIRRARGRLVLATNPDVLFTEELFAEVVSADPGAGEMLRVDRHDVPAELPEDLDFARQMRWCASKVLRVHTRRGTFEPGAWGHRLRHFVAFLRGLASRIVGAGILASTAWGAVPQLRRLRPRHLRRALRAALRALGRISRRVLAASRRLSASLRRFSRRGYHAAHGGLSWVLRQAEPVLRVHTNACGDFTLLARRDWHALRGYPELPLWSMHLDSLLCYMAVSSGLRQRVLRSPARMYHLEHGRSWVALSHRERLETFAERPWLDLGLLHEVWGAMQAEGRPLITNSPGWGLGDADLPEVQPGRPRLATASAGRRAVGGAL